MSETVTQVNETTQQIVRSRTCGLKDFYIATGAEQYCNSIHSRNSGEISEGNQSEN